MNDFIDGVLDATQEIVEDGLFDEILERALALSFWVWVVIGAVFCFLMTPFVFAGLAIRNAKK